MDWRRPEPGRIMGRGHPAGDLLEAYEWRIIEQRPGFLKLDVHLPERVKNFRGQLFGGYTPTYVDLVALRTVHATRAPEEPRMWLTTLNLSVDYFEPIVQERFVIESEILRRRGRTHWVQVRFRDQEANLLALALATIRDVPSPEDMGAG